MWNKRLTAEALTGGSCGFSPTCLTLDSSSVGPLCNIRDFDPSESGAARDINDPPSRIPRLPPLACGQREAPPLACLEEGA